jgi:hypothetical protein
MRSPISPMTYEQTQILPRLPVETMSVAIPPHRRLKPGNLDHEGSIIRWCPTACQTWVSKQRWRCSQVCVSSTSDLQSRPEESPIPINDAVPQSASDASTGEGGACRFLAGAP